MNKERDFLESVHCSKHFALWDAEYYSKEQPGINAAAANSNMQLLCFHSGIVCRVSDDKDEMVVSLYPYISTTDKSTCGMVALFV
jgi:hypothetical protein